MCLRKMYVKKSVKIYILKLKTSKVTVIDSFCSQEMSRRLKEI